MDTNKYNGLESEKKLICPYNNCHIIIQKRMNTHLVKCRKNYPDSKIVSCKFNANHRIPEPEIEYHHEHCPERFILDKFIFAESDGIDKYPIPQHTRSAQEEDWDDFNCPNYDPEVVCKAKPVLRQLKVQPPSLRKKFREEERMRHQTLDPAISRNPLNEVVQISEATGAIRKYGKPLAANSDRQIEEEVPINVAKLVELANRTTLVNPKQQKSKTDNAMAAMSNYSPPDDDSNSDKDENSTPWTASDLAKRMSKSVGRGRARSFK